ncbi:MAG: hypothetical protein IT456_09865 [Planctomycetes bacterium]|jgi:hypothetical protein|nr:hypothetical protein [Planctomycetota bacterium]
MHRATAFALPVLACAQLLAQGRDWPYSMEYGPYLMTTFEGGGLSDNTLKGVVIKLGNSGAVAFDTELLRLSAAWTDGWLRLRGTAYDGAHGPMVRIRGRKVAESKPGPGWAKNGNLADPRALPYGPLAKEWGSYKGLWLHGDQVVVGYTIGGMDVREGYGVEMDGSILTRTLELGPSKDEQLMVVEDGPDGAQPGAMAVDGAVRAAVLQWQPSGNGMVEMDASTAAWELLAMGAPSRGDYLDAASGTGAKIAFVPGFARAHGRKAPPDGAVDTAETLALPTLADGQAQQNSDDWQHSVWFDKYKAGGRETDDGRFVVDLQKSVEVSRINTFTWHTGYRSTQQFDVYGSDAASPDATAADLGAAGWTKIATVDTGSLGEGDKHGVGIARENGLGRFRHLVFDVRSGGAFFGEIDVFADKFRAPVDALGRSVRSLACALRGDAGAQLEVKDGRILMRVPPHDKTLHLQVAMAAGDQKQIGALTPALLRAAVVPPLPTKPGKARWGDAIVTKGEVGAADGAFAVDTITIPFDNRFGSRMRTGAFDLFSDGRAALSTWNGDVWIVSGIDDKLEKLEWKRFATGLFDPLGLRIVDDVVYVHGRDGITRLHDENGDGEADFYECFNNQINITHAFHEFAFDLQTDTEGNFYFSKAAPVNPGGRGFQTIAPHHGTILKLSKDGSQLETIASGLRAPNGIGVSPTGIVTSGDNEGTFMPRCRLNWIEKPGYYAGVKDTAQRANVPDQPDLPLCWMPMEVDNSSGGQVWVTGAGWADLQGRLLHLSYGTCSTYLVLPERVNGQMQGGVVRLPANFSSSCMRGRFSQKDGQLYVVGFQGWQTSAAKEGGFHRVRRTDNPLGVPVALSTCEKGVYVTFAEALDPETAKDPGSFGVEIWNYLYSPNYGSPELSVLHPERKVEQGKQNRDPLTVTAASLSPDGKTVFLAIDGMQPVQQMKITWNLDTKDGRTLKGELHNSIHALQKDPGFPVGR